jgi:hypothetical protein
MSKRFIRPFLTAKAQVGFHALHMGFVVPDQHHYVDADIHNHS